MGETETPRESWFKNYADVVPVFAWGETHEIPSDLDEARIVQDKIEDQARMAGWTNERELYEFKTAFGEGIVDAIKHGNEMNPKKKVRVRVRISSTEIAIAITDEGEGFNPFDVPDPTAPENLERPCGRGILLIDHYMQGWQYDNVTKTLTMWRTRRHPEAENGRRVSSHAMGSARKKLREFLRG